MSSTDPPRRSWVSRSPAPPPPRTGFWGGCLTIAGMGAMCCGATAVLATVKLSGRALAHQVGAPAALLLLVLGAVVLVAVVSAWHRLRQWRLDRWAAADGWSAVPDRKIWPWSARQLGEGGAVTVTHALTKIVDGREVTAGALRWEHDGLGGAVSRSSGTGTFVAIRLSGEHPGASVHRRRSGGRRVRDEELFLTEYRIVIDDLSLADRFTAVALRRAHVRREVPTWTISGDEIYTVCESVRTATPGRIEELTTGLLRVLALLEIPAADPGAPRQTPEDTEVSSGADEP
ncbi:hypothetical protein [Catellatospora tritici]|uniref:hypothetical protein n=1 Tax=Catellatospora tritici TaxID=2851566 RepID=UPI001C2D73CA|nr:hypothetical protein [Catellatospora tritici]MBV1849051.1 hypothetical protein [Catellatospora tritici]